MYYALHEGLRLVLEEGLEARWSRHLRNHKALKAGLIALGLTYTAAEGQQTLPVLLVEKATLVSQLYAWFGDPLGIPVMALRGYQSESYEREIRHWLYERRHDYSRPKYSSR